jgi:cell wall-associated NlpC family hydrolase
MPDAFMTDTHGICLVSCIPGRAANSDKSEMVTQLLFGETYRVLDADSAKNWVKIECTHDKYEAWIDRGLHTPLSVDDFENWISQPISVTQGLITQVENQRTGIVFPILRGSSLPENPKKSFSVAGDEFSYELKDGGKRNKGIQQMMTDFATSYLNAPYLWGGRSPFGLDCSGFTQVIFKSAGIKIPRDAYQQAELGTLVPFVSEAREGDLAFFENADGRIVHVGLVIDEGLIIHASSKVKIGKLDHEGIFDLKENRYTHKLRIVKRII